MKTLAKSLICNHEHTKPRLVAEGRRNPITHRFDGHYVMKLACLDCGSQVPEIPKYLNRQVAYG